MSLNRMVLGGILVAGASFRAMTGMVGCIPDLPADRPPPALAPGCGDGYIDLASGEQCDPGDAGSSGCGRSCEVLCPAGFVWSGNHHCYQLAATSERSLSAGAQRRCTDIGGHVVTFASEAEFMEVADHFQSVDGGVFWVGLQTSANSFVSLALYEPGWGTRCPGCYAHTPDASQALPRSDASAPTAGQGCVAASTAIQVPSWTTYPCNNAPLTHIICEREPPGIQSTACEAGVCIDLVATRGTKRYAYQAAPATPADAESTCELFGGSLVVLQSRDEREQLWHELSQLQSPPARFWIGLLSVDGGASEGGAAWFWDDRTPADAPDAYPPPWGFQQPVSKGATTRAYLTRLPLSQEDTLAHNDDRTVTTLPYVCELRP